MQNPYDVLNVEKDTPFPKIREQYYELSKIFHPDKQSSQTQSKAGTYFASIEEAFKKISTPFRRFVFDSFGEEGCKIVMEATYIFAEWEKEFNTLKANLEEDSMPRDKQTEASHRIKELKRVCPTLVVKG